MNWLRPRQAAVTWVAGILLAACALFMTELSRSSGHLAAIRGAAYIGLTIAGVWGSVLLWNRNDRNALLVMIAAAVLARAALLPATPSLSHDAFRYMWDGRLLRHGVDPYVAPPNDPSLHAFRNDWLYAYIDWNTVPTLYPPVDLALFALADILDDKNTLAIKLLVEVGDLATLSLLIILLRRRNLPIGRAAVYAWSPLVITELAYSGHEEAWCLAALLLAISLTERTRTRLGACVLAVAALVKLYPIALYPAFFPRKSAQPYAIGAALIVAAYAPFYFWHPRVLGFLPAFVAHERFNDTLSAFASPPAAAALLGLAVIVSFIARRRGAPLVGTVIFIELAYLALSPNVYPWYVTIFSALVPLVPGAFVGRMQPLSVGLLGWTLTAPLAYGNGRLYAPDSSIGTIVKAVEYAPVAVGIVIYSLSFLRPKIWPDAFARKGALHSDSAAGS